MGEQYSSLQQKYSVSYKIVDLFSNKTNINWFSSIFKGQREEEDKESYFLFFCMALHA